MARLEYFRTYGKNGGFRALKLSELENYRALKFPDWRVLGPYNPMARLEYFRTLKFSKSESFRTLNLSTLVGI